jgi:hypothetical protein
VCCGLETIPAISTRKPLSLSLVEYSLIIPFSGEFTEAVKDEFTVDFQRFFIKVGGVRYDVKMKYVRTASLGLVFSGQ